MDGYTSSYNKLITIRRYMLAVLEPAIVASFGSVDVVIKNVFQFQF